MTKNFIMKLKLTTLFAFVAFALISCAATFELARNPKNVLYVSPTGNDDTAWYGTSNRPWGTIAGAFAAAQSGDKVLFSAGNFTNIGGVTIAHRGVHIAGVGTNQTFIYSGAIVMQDSNEISKISLIHNSFFGSLLNPAGRCYVHDCSVISSNECVAGGSFSGYNLYSNCLFSTSSLGLLLSGTNYFYNCNISKTTNTPGIGTFLLKASSSVTTIYWSGGSIISTTNDSGSDPTNNYAVWNANFAAQDNVFLQNVTISMPTSTAFDQYTGNSQTNYNSNVTWSGTKTNLAAIIKPFAGFSNTNKMTPDFIPSWVTRINTNAQFELPAPPTNHI